jgi:trans-aconitate 2-methyltransferase
MRRWARQVIDDLELQGDETVLDAGCGSGSVTFDLLERLPSGKIYAVDVSPEMIAHLDGAVREKGLSNVFPICASLTQFTLPEQVDVVFSNAVFHWIANDGELFGSLSRNTRAGGRLRAQCGGAGNIARVMEAARAVAVRVPYRAHITESVDSRKYRTPAQATETMERNGWREVRASLFESPEQFADGDAAAEYLRTIILQQQVAMLPPELGDEFLRDVIAEVESRHGAPFTVDYVRLDLWARRPK